MEIYHIIAESGLTIAEMHKLCSLNKSFKRLCESTDLWKRVFIEKFVRKFGDRRSTRNFAPWNDNPAVALWDELAGLYRNKFTLLVAMAYVKAAGLEYVKLNGKIAGEKVWILVFRKEDDPDNYYLTLNYFYGVDKKRLPLVKQYMQMLTLHHGLETLPSNFIFDFQAKGDYLSMVNVIYSLLDQGWTAEKQVTKILLNVNFHS